MKNSHFSLMSSQSAQTVRRKTRHNYWVSNLARQIRFCVGVALASCTEMVVCLVCLQGAGGYGLWCVRRLDVRAVLCVHMERRS